MSAKNIFAGILIIGLSACNSGPEANGKALAKDFCAKLEEAKSDPMKAASLGMEWAKKAQEKAPKDAEDVYNAKLNVFPLDAVKL